MEKHLGGHQGKTWADEGCLRFAVESFGIVNMIDIGCGPGGMKPLAQKYGVNWSGIDGDPSVLQEGVLTHDFTKGSIPNLPWFGLGWSVEFLEHVEEQYMDNYMQIFSQCDHVICTAAPPGWGGHHHVNEQPQTYWIEKFRDYGLYYDPIITAAMRKKSTMRRKPKRNNQSFMEMTGMYLRNKQ